MDVSLGSVMWGTGWTPTPDFSSRFTPEAIPKEGVAARQQ